MPLTTDAAIAGFRKSLEIALVHTCTITPVTDGAEDTHGNTSSVPGAPVTGVRCTFSTAQRETRGPDGVTTIGTPLLTVSATQAMAVGWQVSTVTDQLGGTPPGAAGTFTVARVSDATADIGAALLPVWELRDADAERAG
jgi:hypothetical protein